MKVYNINATTEKLMKLAEAANSLPGGSVNVSTMWRWTTRGCRGIRLPYLMRGGTRYTSHEAIEWWFAAVTAAANGTALPTQTTKQREREIAEAERVCDEEGI